MVKFIAPFLFSVNIIMAMTQDYQTESEHGILDKFCALKLRETMSFVLKNKQKRTIDCDDRGIIKLERQWIENNPDCFGGYVSGLDKGVLEKIKEKIEKRELYKLLRKGLELEHQPKSKPKPVFRPMLVPLNAEKYLLAVLNGVINLIKADEDNG